MNKSIRRGSAQLSLRASARLRACAAAAASAVALLVAAPREARANDLTIGVGLNYSDRTDLRYPSEATGIDLALGLRSTQNGILHGLELSGGYQTFDGKLDAQLARVMVGARLGIAGVVQPSFFSRFGVGYVDTDQSLGPVKGPGPQLVGEMGVALDIKVLPALEVGVQSSYNWVKFADSFEWWHTGLHMTLVL